jgi:tetratricopeptide (TPR) repeat protein
LANSSEGYTDQSIADYTKALEIDPQFGYALYNRGLVNYCVGKYDDALADYTEGAALNMGTGEAYQGFVQYVPARPADDTNDVRGQIIKLLIDAMSASL